MPRGQRPTSRQASEEDEHPSSTNITGIGQVKSINQGDRARAALQATYREYSCTGTRMGTGRGARSLRWHAGIRDRWALSLALALSHPT